MNDLFKKSIEDIRQKKFKLTWTRTFDLSTAKSDEEIIVNANYLEGIDLQGHTTVKFNHPTNDAFVLIPGICFKTPFERIYLSSLAQSNSKVTLRFAVIDYNPVFEIGTVHDFDNDMVHSLDHKSFACESHYTSAAGNYGHLQLFNPIGSGVILKVTGLYATVYSLYMAVACTGVIGAGYMHNKYFGGAAPKAELRYQDDAAILGEYLVYIPNYFQPNPVIIIPEGFGIGSFSGGYAVTTALSVEWTEL